MLIKQFVALPEEWFAWDMLGRVWMLSFWIAAGISCYFLVLWITGVRWQNMTAQR
ncbi:MAG: hypothetical protein AAF419_04685 [Pseudomonadota bacterium]